MPKKLKDFLESLRDSSGKINKESDELTQAIIKLESALARFNLGIPVWLSKPIESSEDETTGAQFVTQLGYAKSDHKQWALLLVDTIDGEENGTIKLSEAKRDDKLLAMEFMELLIEELHQAAQAKLQSISSAKAKAQQIAADIEGAYDL